MAASDFNCGIFLSAAGAVYTLWRRRFYCDLIALVCALQVQTFRKVRGLPFASTMCTGNLRSGMESLAKGFLNEEREELSKAWHYGLIILCFILGAVLGAVL
ncbi:MAG: YoaK family protein, partial [Victivallaceae bacterium]